MPEEFEGQHQALMINPISLELYLLSNNLQLRDTSLGSEASIRSRDTRVIGMFRSLGQHGMKQLTRLLLRKEPTIEAIADKLFASAIRLFDVPVARILLEAHMDPDQLIEINTVTDRGLVTPLAWAAHVACDQSSKMMEALLSHGANVSHGVDTIFREEPAMFAAIRGNNPRAIRLLLRYRSMVPLNCLAEAARTVDLELFTELLSSCPNLLDLYAETKDDVSCRYLKYFESNIDFHSKGYTTILGGAAKSGRLEIIDIILRTCPTVINPERSGTLKPYFSPLTLAIGMNHTHCIEPLIQAGVGMGVTDNHFPLVEYALINLNLDAVEILLRYGANIERRSGDGKFWSSALIDAILLDYDKAFQKLGNAPFSDHIQLIDHFIKNGARLNDEYEYRPGTVLGAAIQKGDLKSHRGPRKCSERSGY
jgi:ankyrin repeat protein